MGDKNQQGGYTQQSGKSKVKEVQRGTQDKLEILGLVVAQLPVLRANVLDKLRAAKDRIARKQQNQKARTGA